MECARSGMGECRNYLQNVLPLADDTFACGSDSGKQTCYALTGAKNSFHAPAFTGVAPNAKFITENIEHSQLLAKLAKNKKKIILSAGSFSRRRSQVAIQMTVFDTLNFKMTKIREKNFKGN